MRSPGPAATGALPPGDGPEAVVHDVGEGWGLRCRHLSLARLEDVLRAHDRALAQGTGLVLKRGRKSAVTRHGDLVVKEHVPFGRLGRLRDRLAPGRHQAGVRHAWRLLALGVGTARPRAWLRRRGRVFALYEDLSALPRLDVWAHRLYRSGTRADQVRLRDASADWLARLHGQGVFHGDLKGMNVLVGEAGGRPAFLLVDTDRVRFTHRPVGRGRRARNLAQLAASIPTSVSVTERLRWLDRYGEASPALGGRRPFLRAVGRFLAPRTRATDAPLE